MEFQRRDDEEPNGLDADKLSTILERLQKPEQELVVYDTLDLVPYGLDEPWLSLFTETQKLDDEGST